MSSLHTVLGAGPAGLTLAGRLADLGQRVRLVDRSHTVTDGRIESVRADLSDPDEAIRATKGAAVIYHCVNVAYHLQVDLMPGISEAVLAAAAAQGARLVVLDTLYPYGEADGEHITEATPWSATTRKGVLRKRLDERYLAAHARDEVSVALGRSADFFGPRVLNSTLGGAFFPAALTGDPVAAFGDIDLPHSYTYIEDVASGLVTLGRTGRGDGRIWHLPTAPAVSTARIHSIVEDLIGGTLRVDLLTEAVPYGPFDEVFMAEYDEMFYQHRIPQNMVSADFERTFGVAPTPLRAALTATLEWYRAFLDEQAESPARRA